MDIDVNFRNIKRYKTAKYPLHQGIFGTWLICCLTKPNMLTKLAFATEEIYQQSMNQKKLTMTRD